MAQSQHPDMKVAVARIARELRRHLAFQAQLCADGAPRATPEQLAELKARITRAELQRDRAAFAELGRPTPPRHERPAQRPAPAATATAPTTPPPQPTPPSAPSTPAQTSPPRPAMPGPARRPADPSSPYKIVDLLQRTARPAAEPPVEAPAAPADRGAQLHRVREELGDCRRCRLCETRTQIVFGQGSPTADLVFIGDAPGRTEDEKGEPFVGRSGELLTRMIGAMKLSRDEVYVCNIVKCRPPGNRDPNPEELDACAPFIASQLQAIAPRVIVTLGAHATRTLLGTDAPLAQLRGNWHRWRGIPVMPTFHPNYVLRFPNEKRPVWDDLKKVMTELGKMP